MSRYVEYREYVLSHVPDMPEAFIRIGFEHKATAGELLRDWRDFKLEMEGKK